MEDLEVDLIKLLLIIGFLYLIWMKSLWEELDLKSTTFYPDGLDKCPPDTYTIDDNRNRARCTACPVCLVGMEPSPPCGSLLVRKAAGKCVPCKAGTYSNEEDSDKCKVCTDCGSKEVVSSCTAETNAECMECPLMHFDDKITLTCKPCTLCCVKDSAAQKDCFISGTCAGNCSQSTTIKENYYRSNVKKLVARTIKSHFTKTLKLSRRQKGSQDMNNILLENTANTKLEEPTNSERLKRDIIQGDFKATTFSETKQLVLFDSSVDKDIDGNEIDDLNSLSKPKDVSKGDEEKTYTTTPDSLDTHEEQEQPAASTRRPPILPPIASDSDIREFVLPIPENKNQYETFNNTAVKSKRRVPAIRRLSLTASTIRDANIMSPTIPIKIAPTSRAAIQQSVVPSAASFLSSFSGTLAALGVLGLIGLIIYLAIKGCVRIRRKGYRKTSEREGPEECGLGDDHADESSNEDDMARSPNDINTVLLDQNEAIQIAEDLNLSEIPPDLEDILVTRLDVTHGTSDCKEYGWVKVGNAAGISRHELKFYQNEYLRPNGSPTKLLLEKLGSQGKTISFLIDVLQAPVVQLDNVATSLRYHVTRV